MFQFGEILTLAISVVTVAFLLANRRRIGDLPTLRPFLGPFLLLVVAWVATVAEGIFLEGPDLPLIVFGQESIGVAHQSIFSALLNLAEHAGYAGSAVWLLVAVARRFKASREAPA